MLVLSRKQGEQVRVGDNIEIVVVAIQGDRVRLGFTAPDDVGIHREEVFRRMKGDHDTLEDRHGDEKECDQRSRFQRNPGNSASPSRENGAPACASTPDAAIRQQHN